MLLCCQRFRAEHSSLASKFKKISLTEQNNLDLYRKWHRQSLHKKNFVPWNDVLKHLWSRSKLNDIVWT